jgi:glutathione peroxidase
LQETIATSHPARHLKERAALSLMAIYAAALVLFMTAAPSSVWAQPKPAATKAAKKGAAAGDPAKSADAKTEKTAYDYNLPGADGKDVPVATYKGKYILIVNLARKSSYNDQLPALIRLNDKYKDKGLIVLGIPSNDFGAEEPGKDAEIQKAYSDAKVDFPVMAVSKVSGDGELPLVNYLTKSKGAPPGGAVHWNYTKFIIDKKGAVIARLGPDVAPDSPEFLSTVDQVLDGTFKPAKKGGDKPGDPDDDE